MFASYGFGMGSGSGVASYGYGVYALAGIAVTDPVAEQVVAQPDSMPVGSREMVGDSDKGKAFLGVGPKFPITFGPNQSMALSYYEQHLKEAIRIRLDTRRGWRRMRRNWGSNVPLIVFDPNDRMLMGQIRAEIMNALSDEHRIQVLQVLQRWESTDPVRVLNTIEYLIVNTNVKGNLVYPWQAGTGLRR